MNPHHLGDGDCSELNCRCVRCAELIPPEQLRALLRSCLRAHAPEQLRMRIVVEVRKAAHGWEDPDKR